MAINKPRGSQVGLRKNREETKRQNTDAMWKVINRLRKEKMRIAWTYKEVWSGAGLKSNIALKSPWNNHIREAIDEHNKKIREEIELGPVGFSQRKTLRDQNKELRKQLDAAKKERDLALSQIAVWEAEADHYNKEHGKLLKVNERLNEKVKQLAFV